MTHVDGTSDVTTREMVFAELDALFVEMTNPETDPMRVVEIVETIFDRADIEGNYYD